MQGLASAKRVFSSEEKGAHVRDARGTGEAAALSNDLRSMPRLHARTPEDESSLPTKSLHVRILVLSDVRFVHESLAKLFARDRTITLADCAAGLDEALAQLFALHPDIVLVDAAFANGLEAVRRIRDVAPEVHIVALALAETEESIIMWAEAGISGYIPKSAALSDVTRVLRNVMHGEQHCSARVSASLLRRIGHSAAFANREIHPAGGITLTRREFQIAQLIGRGLSNKEIARHLKIELATTKSHVHNLLAKLNLQRRTQVAFWLHRHVDRGFDPSAHMLP
jgi:DNA-binding NarL/FixJ family response regulator